MPGQLKADKYNSDKSEASAMVMLKNNQVASSVFSETYLHMIAQKMKHSLYSILQGQKVAYKYACALLSEPIITLPLLRWNSFVTR